MFNKSSVKLKVSAPLPLENGAAPVVLFRVLLRSQLLLAYRENLLQRHAFIALFKPIILNWHYTAFVLTAPGRC